MNRIPSTKELIKQLIAIPSISSTNLDIDQSNHAVIDLMANWLNDLGFTINIQTTNLNPKKANLIASIGEGDQGLVIAGHTDTVPYDIHPWESDPFTLTEKENKLFGLGTTDMKGFLAIALDVIQHYQEKDLNQPITLIATADEETSMAGAKSLIENKNLLGRYAIIGEPTNMTPIRMHKGIMMECIKIIGKSGHSSNPLLGNSALEGMQQVITSLLAWKNKLQEKYREPIFDVPIPTLNLGHIHGGDNPNRICAECELHFDLRPLPGMERHALREEISLLLQEISAANDLSIELMPLFDGVDAIATPKSSPIITACEQLTGREAGAVNFATEAPFFNKMGMDVIVLGPGNINVAHQPNEYLDMKHIEPTKTLLHSLISNFCIDN